MGRIGTVGADPKAGGPNPRGSELERGSLGHVAGEQPEHHLAVDFKPFEQLVNARA